MVLEANMYLYVTLLTKRISRSVFKAKHLAFSCTVSKGSTYFIVLKASFSHNVSPKLFNESL